MRTFGDDEARLMPRESAFVKARRLLAEGRIIVRRADGRRLVARVRGDSAHLYTTGFDRGTWFCSCAHAAQSTRCSHVIALMLLWIEPGSGSR